MMNRNWIFILVVSFCLTFSRAQRNSQRNNSQNMTTMQRAAFDIIVTPEPIEPNSSTEFPTQFSINDTICTCVPYFMCDPDQSTSVTTADNRVNVFGEINIRFDPQSCQDVLDVCCFQERQTEVPVQPPPIQRPVAGCGVRNVGGIDFTIAGNTNDAGFAEFPWTVAVIKISTDDCLCGGSLIHPNVVLTGAHCVDGILSEDLKIRAGEWDTQTIKERLPYQERTVLQVVVHLDFSTKTLSNDIALLFLNNPVTLDEHINVVCLPTQGYISNSKNCFASGWGKDLFGKLGKYSVVMKKVKLPMVEFGFCEKELKKTRLTKKFQLHRSFVCAGGQSGIDTCEGDGGSPLICPIGARTDNRYVQVGAVAWGLGCKEPIPAVYVNIAAFRNWIDTNVRGYGHDPAVYTHQINN